MNTTLLIFHALLSVALLGAITHQVFGAWRRPGGVTGSSFAASFRSVRPPTYTNAVILLYIATSILGDLVYPLYRLEVRTALDDLGFREANGIFEIKEHFAAIGLFMLPAYWLYWQSPLGADTASARRWITTILAFFVWWNFLVGHILNNIKGFGQ